MSTHTNDVIFEEVSEWLEERNLKPKDVLMDSDCRYYVNELVEMENGDAGAYCMTRSYLPSEFYIAFN